MRGVGIITDASAHFLTPRFTGSERVHILPLPILWEGQHYLPPSARLTAALPPSLLHQPPPRLQLPSPTEIARQIKALLNKYDSLLFLPMGSSLTDLFQRAAEAVNTLSKHRPVYLVDTHTLDLGLGWLVQEAAALAAQDADIFTILSHIRGMVQRLYAAFCLRSLTYLHHSGFLEPAQAIIGEMLEMYPFFVLETGRLVPLQKARSSRHVLDIMEEFTLEFTNLQRIGITHHTTHFHRAAYNLHTRLTDKIAVPVHVSEINTVSAVLLGPKTLGIHILTE